MIKTVYSRLALVSVIGLLAVAFFLAPHSAFASTTQSHLSQRSSVPNGVYTKPVYPRLSLYRCSRQDGYNGNVQWVTIPNGESIKTWGELWDVCGTTVYLYLTWYDPGYENYPAGRASSFSTSGVNYSHGTLANAGHISVTLCAWWYNRYSDLVWTCGTPYSV